MRPEQSNSNHDMDDDPITAIIANKYWPYRYVFLLAAFLSIGMGYALLSYINPIYEASATLLIKDEMKGNPESSKLTESLDLISAKKIVENEIEVIKSRRLMNEVIHKLRLYAPISEVTLLKNTSGYISSPISVFAVSPDSLQEQQEIKLYFNPITEQIVLNDTFKYPINKVVDTPFGMLEFRRNTNFKVAPRGTLYFKLINPRYIVDALRSNLSIQAPNKLSSIINLTYRDELPQLAEDILNELIIAYNNSENTEKEELAKYTLDFVEHRLGLISQDLDSIEKKVEEYKAGRGAVNISTQGHLYLQNVSMNDQKLSDINTQLAVLSSVENFVQNKSSTGGIVPSAFGLSDPMLRRLIDELYTSELEYEKLKKTVGENNPQLASVQYKLKTIRPGILRNIESQREGLLATKRNIQSTNGNYNSLLQSVPEKERQLIEISRKQQIKSNIYSFLLQKKEETELAYASSVSRHRIIDYAQAGYEPVGPKKLYVYLASFAVFFSACAIAITIREALGGKILYRHQIEAGTSIPIISELAYNDSKQNLIGVRNSRSAIAEEFRRLRISLSFLGIDSKHKKLLVTSSIEAEGKTFTTANLAASLSLTGKKVVIVDFDLYKPSMHRFLQMEQCPGISDYLAGRSLIEQTIKPVKFHENLYFVPAGKEPENPTELLSSEKVKEIIDYLERKFDAVVIDTPPIMFVTDAYILSPLCDATLYLIRSRYTPKHILKQIDRHFKINHLANPAIVFNGIRRKGFMINKKYGYGYTYSAGAKSRQNEDRFLKVSSK